MSIPIDRAPEWEFLLPAPGRGDNAWVLGPCWLFCGHQVTAVTWIGAVTTLGALAPLYACSTCLSQLNAMVWDFADISSAAPVDGEGRRTALYRETAADHPASTFAGPGPLIRTPLGKRFAQLLGWPR
ncbi:hypothetical protein SAMN06297387_1145 [Streptomyces zhaozhouensis]|uniref:Uncharacterized protein n=1 Tax=Streptomyces zhaozhouensis TaxID=1300267 RepID=A0A286DZE0_9ACTN|nr:hypothetical protein [Streptomyces zhaozhouensis]SOD64026.1 hypothetical protein SAMN06297387_1145 [Streptomyces zhaozhouensis]